VVSREEEVIVHTTEYRSIHGLIGGSRNNIVAIMSRKFLHGSALAAAGIATMLGAAEPTKADGFVAETFIKPWSPALAQGLDSWSAQVQARTSDASVGNHLLCGVPCFQNPIGRPAQYGGAPMPSPAYPTYYGAPMPPYRAPMLPAYTMYNRPPMPAYYGGAPVFLPYR
jgi:hypothetical protein